MIDRRDVPAIYALTDSSQGSHSAIARRLFECGVRWLQIREKQSTDADLYQEVIAVMGGAPKEATVFINDRADIALAAGAHGVHLGDEDLPPAMARAAAERRPMLIGYSTHSFEDFQAASADPAIDYIAIGPIFRSPTKDVRKPLGPDILRRLRPLTTRPIVAIGGIDSSNIASVLEAGADSAAVISAIYARGTIEDNVRALLDAAGERR